jgi:hypothetical protein
MDINKDILRWVLLIGAIPIWLPFLRMLWKDFNRALAEEGGVFGKAPTAQEAERIRREKLTDPELLVSEPWARRGERNVMRGQGPGRSSAGRAQAAGPSRAGAGSGSAPRFRANPTKPGPGGERGRGFR